MTAKRKKTGRPSNGRVNGYSRREWLIFRFWDGTREVAADPLRISRGLLNVPGLNLEEDIKLATLANPMAGKAADEAVARLVGAVQSVFGVKEFREERGKAEGLTDFECIQLLNTFGAYIGDLKKKLSPSPTSTTPTDPSAESPPTPTSADSTGTGAEPPTATP